MAGSNGTESSSGSSFVVPVGSPPIAAGGRGTARPPARRPPRPGDALLIELGGQPSRLGAVGSVELPRGVDGALDQVVLDGVARGELIEPGVEAAPIDLGVLAGEDGQLARQPCLRALKRERAFPWGVLGPVLLFALRRLISARSMVVVTVGRPRGWSGQRLGASRSNRMAPGGTWEGVGVGSG